MLSRRQALLSAAGAGAALTIGMPTVLRAQDLKKVTMGTNWVAQAEHGGFYQSVADGTYKKYGLDVTILPGGPQANNRLLLSSGRIEFFMGGNMLEAFAGVAEGIPTRVVAANFQKEPQILMSHPGQGMDTFMDLKKSNSIYVSKGALASYYLWMVAEFGFTEAQTKPYNFTSAPFLADKTAVQQGYLTSEPFAIEKEGGFKPNIFLLADQGFDTYSTTIDAQDKLIADDPALVQAFVDATAIGWYNYMYGDNKAANDLIKKDNPEMSDEQIAFSIAKMKEYGIVDSGDSLELGINCMTDARQKSFYDKMVKVGAIKPEIDLSKAYTLQFVNKKVGLELRPK